MSYPYQQGPPQGMPGMPPYPQQPQYGQPPSSVPYPGAHPSAPYSQQQQYPSSNPYLPQSFNEPAPYSTQFQGFGLNTPIHMPMPMNQSSMVPNSMHMPMGQNPINPNPMPMGSSCMPPMPNPMHQPPQPSIYTPPMPQSQAYSSPQCQTYPPPQSQTYPPPQSQTYPPSQSHGSLYPNIGQQCPGETAPSYPKPVAPPTHYGALGSAPPVHGHSMQHSYKSKYSATVLPAEPFEPRLDAETLRKAMKGFGTDEKAIIQVLANRTNAQRLEIGVQFKTLYGKDLVKDLKSETSGRFEDLLVAMMTPLPQFYAKEIHEALAGIGTDEDTLIEVFCTMNNNELRTVRAAYEMMYHNSLENDLAGDTSGTFRRLMVSLCTANRDESMHVDPDYVQRDAQALLRAGELKFGTDESTFNAVLCQRNYAHLCSVFQEYERITGHDFEKVIKNEFSGDEEEAFLAVVRSIKDKAQFFAKRLHQSMKGMGTNDRQLIRLILTRSEIDMGDIKNAYQAKYGEALGDAISSDCSGDYKKCLLALINI